MTNKRITELTALDGDDVADNDVLAIVDVSDTTMAASGTTKKITVAELVTDSALTNKFWPNSTTALTGANLANGDKLAVVDVGSPDVAKYITADELAQGSQFSSRFVQKSEDDLCVVGAGEMVAAFGSPVITRIITYYSTWALDASSAESLGFNVLLPEHWGTFHADVMTLNTTVGSGDIRWIFHRSIVANGAAMSGTNTSVTVAVGSQNVLTYQRVLTSGTNTAGSGMFCYLERDASNVADTFASDINVIGMIFTKAS